jgi:hypothetical protein
VISDVDSNKIGDAGCRHLAKEQLSQLATLDLDCQHIEQNGIAGMSAITLPKLLGGRRHIGRGNYSKVQGLIQSAVRDSEHCQREMGGPLLVDVPAAGVMIPQSYHYCISIT